MSKAIVMIDSTEHHDLDSIGLHCDVRIIELAVIYYLRINVFSKFHIGRAGDLRRRKIWSAPYLTLEWLSGSTLVCSCLLPALLFQRGILLLQVFLDFAPFLRSARME